MATTMDNYPGLHEDDTNSTYCEKCGCRITGGQCKHGVHPPRKQVGTFGGEKYLLTFQRDSKTEANTEANHLRQQGYAAKVVKNPKFVDFGRGPYRYHVYRRSRRSPRLSR